MYEKYFYNYNGNNSNAISFCLQTLVKEIMQGEEDSTFLQRTMDLYANSSLEPFYFRYHNEECKMTNNNAISIIENANKYPRELVVAAERICRNKYNSLIIPVGKIAIDDEWFNQESY